jgi:hypothetical protein
MAVIVRPQKISRKKLRGWTPSPKFQDTKRTPNLKFEDTKMDTKPLSY